MLDGVARLRQVASECAGAAVWALSDRELVDCLTEVCAAQQQVAAATAHLVRQVQVRDLPGKDGATSVPVWLRLLLNISPSAGQRLVRLGEALDRRPRLDDAMSAGTVSAEQTQVIAAALADIPAEAGTDAVRQAEDLLIEWAAEFDATRLGMLGRRVLSHVAPHIAEERDAQALQRQERRARQGRGFTLSPLGDGSYRIHGQTSAADAATISAALAPLCHPGHDLGEVRTAAQRRHDALLDICARTLKTNELPAAGGDAAQVVVTLNFDTLRRQVGVGMLDTGQPVSPAEARRIACDAQILPAVLGGDGQVLDLGRARRLITGALRRALVLRDRGCTFPGCDRPPQWCDGHHVQHWAEGGPTCLTNSVLLCGFHHRLIHHSDWQVHITPDGTPEFIPPTTIDPLQRPRRNTYHRRE